MNPTKASTLSVILFLAIWIVPSVLPFSMAVSLSPIVIMFLFLAYFSMWVLAKSASSKKIQLLRILAFPGFFLHLWFYGFFGFIYDLLIP